MASVTMPQLGESITEGTISKWLKKPGDQVKKYESLVEVITDKVNAEVPSPLSGTLEEIKVAEGTTVAVGTEICVISEVGAKSGSPSTGGGQGQPKIPSPSTGKGWSGGDSGAERCMCASVPPAARTPSFTRTASWRRLKLHGMVSVQVLAMPMIGFCRSSSVKPIAL